MVADVGDARLFHALAQRRSLGPVTQAMRSDFAATMRGSTDHGEKLHSGQVRSMMVLAKATGRAVDAGEYPGFALLQAALEKNDW
jgi:hypothetical protein